MITLDDLRKNNFSELYTNRKDELKKFFIDNYKQPNDNVFLHLEMELFLSKGVKDFKLYVVAILDHLDDNVLINVLNDIKKDDVKSLAFSMGKFREHDFAIKLIKKCNIDFVNEAMIQYHKQFFQQDSHELRNLLYKEPQVYSKLAKLDCKPNIAIEFLKELINVHGTEHFCIRLSKELREDQEFMSHAIIDNPTNLFYGSVRLIEERIRKNAIGIFKTDAMGYLNIFDIYGVSYLYEHYDNDFVDLNEYLKTVNRHHATSFLTDRLSEEDKKTLLLRGGVVRSEYDSLDFSPDTDFEELLAWNLSELLEKDFYSQETTDFINDTFKKHKKMIDGIDKLDRMILANNIAVAYAKGVYKEFEQISGFDPNEITGITLDMNVLNKEIIDKLGIDTIQKISYYPGSLYVLSQVIKEGKIDLYTQLLEKVPKNNNKAPANNVNVLLYSVYMHENAVKELISSNNVTEKNIEALIDITTYNRVLPIEHVEDIINFNSRLETFCDENIEKCADINYAKQLFFARIFKVNRREAQRLIVEYKDGLKLKSGKDFAKIEILELIDAISDIDVLKSAYKKFASSRKPIYSGSFKEIEDKLKETIIGEEFISKEDTALSVTKGEESLVSAFKENGVEMITLDPNKKFKMLVHIVGAFGETPGQDSTFYESWNTNLRSHYFGISTSLITEDYLSVASLDKCKKDNAGKLYLGVTLGFNQGIDNDDILKVAPYDIWSSRNGLINENKFRANCIDSDNLPSFCRGARGDYSEILISRYSNGEKRQPDYIILFDYQCDVDQYKAYAVAKQFNIPVVYVDTQKFYDVQNEKFQKQLAEFRDNRTLENAEKLFSQVETLTYGFRRIPTLKGKYFISNKDLEDCSREILALLNEQDKKNFEEFLKEEDNKRRLKGYFTDRKSTVKKAMKENASQRFHELRKQYGTIEALKMSQLYASYDKLVASTIEPSFENVGGKHNGK